MVKYQALSYLKILRYNYNLASDEEKYFIITSFDKPKSGIDASTYIDNALSSLRVLTLKDEILNFLGYEEKN